MPPNITPIPPHWQLHNGHILLPTQSHLVTVCTRAARLSTLDRHVQLHALWPTPPPTTSPTSPPPPSPSSTTTLRLPTSPTTTTSISVPTRIRIHYSRLYIQGGPLHALATPFYPAPIPPIRLHAPPLAIRTVVDFHYCAAINLSHLSLADAIHTALLAHRLALQQLPHAIQLNITLHTRLTTPLSLRLAASLVPISRPSSPFLSYFFTTARSHLSRLTLPDVVAIAWAAHAAPGPSATLLADVFHAVLSAAMLRHDDDLRTLIPLFDHVAIPPPLAPYLVARVAALYHRLVAHFHLTLFPNSYSPVTPEVTDPTRYPLSPADRLFTSRPLSNNSYHDDIVDDLMLAEQAAQTSVSNLRTSPNPHPPPPLASLQQLWRILVSVRLADDVIARLSTTALTAVNDEDEADRVEEDENDTNEEEEEEDDDDEEDDTSHDGASSVPAATHNPTTATNEEEQAHLEHEDDTRALLSAVCQYAEPWTRDDDIVLRMLRRIAPLIVDSTTIFRDSALTATWSPRAMRLATIALLCERTHAITQSHVHTLNQSTATRGTANVADGHSEADGGACIVAIVKRRPRTSSSRIRPPSSASSSNTTIGGGGGSAASGINLDGDTESENFDVRGGEASIHGVRITVDDNDTPSSSRSPRKRREFALWLRWRIDDGGMVSALSFWCRPLQGRCPCVEPDWRVEGWGDALVDPSLPGELSEEGERLVLTEDEVLSWLACHHDDCRLLLSVDVRVVLRE